MGGASARLAARDGRVTASDWSSTDLARRVDRAFDAAEAALALVGAEDVQLDLSSLEAPPHKIIAETAMFLGIAAGVPSTVAPGVAERAHDLAQILLPHARHPRVAVGIALHPALALDYATPHIMLRNMGHPDAEFDRALAVALAATTAHARERVPYRELEQAWLGSLAGPPAPRDRLLARTALTRGIDLVTGSRDDVYAFTHALMYATDFGRRRMRLAGSTREVLATAESAIAGALDDDDFDVAGELLLTWPCLGAAWSPAACLAFSVLARVEDEVGILPSLAIDRAGYDQQPAASRRHYVAAVTYHTAYVMGILCALMLRCRSRPARALPAGPYTEACAEELVHRLGTVTQQPHWWANVRALPPGRLSWCVSFLLDVALRRAVRRLDLAEVQQLLRIGMQASVQPSPLCAQAAGTLRRLAGCAALLSRGVPPGATNGVSS
jgi:hypothetical protein